jgi:hypothetical protein
LIGKISSSASDARKLARWLCSGSGTRNRVNSVCHQAQFLLNFETCLRNVLELSLQLSADCSAWMSLRPPKAGQRPALPRPIPGQLSPHRQTAANWSLAHTMTVGVRVTPARFTPRPTTARHGLRQAHR